jgi:alkylhydroperoxidase family enzyme
LARRHGASDHDLATLDDLARSSLPDPEKEAIRFAEKVTRDHRAVQAEDIDRLRGHWEIDQIVELLCVIGLFNYLNRFAEALALEPTKPGEGGPGTSEGGSRGE